MNKLFFLALTILFTACLSNNTSPEAALKDFIESRIGKVVERDFILKRVTGKMLQSFENMSDEEFNKFSDMKNIKSDSFKILSKSCQENKCFVTYSVSYFTQDGDKSKYQSEIKKIAEMVLVDSRWLIADVSNIKTYIENLEPISP